MSGVIGFGFGINSIGMIVFILSAFRLKTGVKVWVLTEAVGDEEKRASTCLLLRKCPVDR